MILTILMFIGFILLSDNTILPFASGMFAQSCIEGFSPFSVSPGLGLALRNGLVWSLFKVCLATTKKIVK